jgi:hypothetical protein
MGGYRSRKTCGSCSQVFFDFIAFTGSSLFCMGSMSTHSAKWGTGAEELSLINRENKTTEEHRGSQRNATCSKI